MTIKLGVIREGKNPPDKRVPLTPQQCLQVQEKFPNVEIFVQTSPIRAFKDAEYSDLGIPVVEDLSNCDIILGVKEVNIPDLIPHKHFLFFSHTIKKQSYNRKLLQAIIAQKIQLTDYEVLTNSKRQRVIGFGRYAGVVGCYNAFLTYGLKHGAFSLKPANQCRDREEMERELPKINLPANTKIVLTGDGRVAHGAMEILKKIQIKKVEATQFLTQDFEEPVYTCLTAEEYNARDDGKPFDLRAFYENPAGHHSTFQRYLKKADIYIAAHYWKAGSPYLYTRNDLKIPDLKTQVVADISCDIDGPVASTIRPSTIEKPIYGYDIYQEKEVDFQDKGAIAVMAIDNLPCELPKDASHDFGEELIANVLPELLGNDPENRIERATITTKDGKLSSYFHYLNDYLDGK